MNATTLSSALSGFTYGLLPLFYLVPPHHTYFKEIEDIPDYVQQVIPYFFLLILIEAAILWWNRSTIIRFNDVIGSVTGGILLQLSKAVLFRGLEVSIYVWVYNNYSMIQLPWDSPITWWVCFLTYDFMFYWFHRATHEINIFWAFHQMHHSSEEYNLSTALRQSAFQQCISWIFNLPLALFIPPTQFIVHVQFNLLYQFWIHTEVIDRLGPLEYILNTPSHHRVHHGRNRYCIDKNYSAVFIIWDVMFGTFSPESDKVYYGLVHPVRTFNPITLQFFHLVHVLKSAWRANGLINKLSVLFKGPGWYPGTSRLGNPEDIPVVPVDIKPYNKAVPGWIHFYCIFHFVLTNIVTVLLGTKQQQEMSYITVLVISFFLLFCLTNIGMIYDVNSLAPSLEVVRLLMLLVTDHLFRPYVFTNAIPGLVLCALQFSHLLSLLLWISACYKQLK